MPVKGCILAMPGGGVEGADGHIGVLLRFRVHRFACCGAVQPFPHRGALSHVALCAVSANASPIMAIERIQLHTHGDDRGLLISLEQARNVPFEIRRVYYLFGTRAGVHRGQHAHRQLNQLAVALHGSVAILVDEGKGEGPTEVVLDDPSQGLLLGRMVWRDLHRFSPDCVLMVLADQLYDPADYIVDYDQFLSEVRGDLPLEACRLEA